MADDKPTSADREQQRADNTESRRQSGLEPLPRDREPRSGARNPKDADDSDSAERSDPEETDPVGPRSGSGE